MLHNGQMAAFSLDAYWRDVETVRPPEPVYASCGPEQPILPAESPSSRVGRIVPWVWVGIGAVGIVLAIAGGQLLWIPLLAAGGFGFWTLVGSRAHEREAAMRLARLDEARRAHLALVERADTLGPGGFFALRKRLASLSEEYQVKVPGQERQAGQACERKARERQLRTYLARYRVDDAKVAGLGPARKATLASHGIRSAADIRRSSIEDLPGFGPSLCGALLNWREACAQGFQFDPTDVTFLGELNTALAPHRRRRNEIERELVAGLEGLRRLSSPPRDQTQLLIRALTDSSRELAQAHLDAATA